jgi:hypothetical protein
VNKVSIAYHAKMGFEIVKGDSEVDGVSETGFRVMVLQERQRSQITL